MSFLFPGKSGYRVYYSGSGTGIEVSKGREVGGGMRSSDKSWGCSYLIMTEALMSDKQIERKEVADSFL